MSCFKQNDRKVLATGSSGHLGEAMARRLKELNHEVVGLDIIKSKYDFSYLPEQLKQGNELQSPLAKLVGSKEYHV